MAFEIVDGMTGTKHISSDDLSALNIATVGKADCVLGYGDNFELTMRSANSATLGTGVGMVGGKRFWNQAATNLTVQSGTQGQKRNDLVVARYAKTSAGIESITPVVVKGTPSTGAAADPGTTSNDLKLWRIPLDGISVGTPVRLFDPVASLATLGDSVSQTIDAIESQAFSDIEVSAQMRSGIVCVNIYRAKNDSHLSLSKENVFTTVGKIKQEYWPSHNYVQYIGVQGSAWLMMAVTRRGEIVVYHQYQAGTLYWSYFEGSLSYPIA